MSTPNGEYTGKDVSYYLVEITNPKRLDPYTAECEDIIEALGMTFAEGCAFKAIWRKCAARTLGRSKAGYKGGLYDAEKAQYYGARMVAAEERLVGMNPAFGAGYVKTFTGCPECGCPTDEAGTHYATCSKLTAPKEFVAEVEATFDGLEIHEPTQDIVMHVNHKPFDWDADDPNPEPPSMSNEEAAQGLQDIIDSEDVRMDNIARSGNDGEHYAEVEDPFAGAPEWAKFKAQDADGRWFWYEKMPSISPASLSWERGGQTAYVKFLSTPAHTPNWRDTLIERP